MKKIWMMMAMVAIFTACSSEEELDFLVGNYTLTGYADVESRTAFGTPGSSSIPFEWSKGDMIWAGTTQSNAIATGGKSATFTFASEPTGTVYYNMTGSSAQAKVIASQNIGDLGTNGDFGYGTISDGSFTLSHATAYLWFDVTSSISGAILETIKVNADGSYIAGEAYWNGSSFDTVTDGSSIIELTVGQTLTTTNNNVWAMVVLPANLQGKTVKVTYKLTVNNATKYYTQTLSGKNLPSGTTQKITANIANNDLTDYAELRVLTFEDEDTKFTPYSFKTSYYDSMTGDEETRTYSITKWSDLIPNEDYGDEMIYGIYSQSTWSYGGIAEYYWEDKNNTLLSHEFPAYTGFDWMTYEEVTVKTYQRQGEVLSNSYAPNLSGDYGQYLKERYVYATPPTNGTNTFCVHHGYSDFYNPKDELSGFGFSDGVARVIDHMYVANTSYVYSQLQNGFSFGVSYDGLDSHVQFKVVAYGYDSATDTNPTTCEFFLVKDGVIVEDWTKWDLTSLGAVVRVEFNMVGSPFDLLDRYPDTSQIPGDIDDITGAYGLGAPGYFAYDNIAVQF